MASMRGGRVAENSTVWRSVGRRARGSTRCPRRSPCRASRRPRRARPCRTPSSCSVPRLMWSIARPGRGDDDVHAVAQGAELAADRLAAVDRQHPGAELAAVAVHRLGHLHGELAGRHEHEGDGSRPADGRIEQLQRRAGRTRRSCRCPWRPGRARRGRRGSAGSRRAGSASAPRSRARSARSAAPGAARARRTPRSIAALAHGTRWKRPGSTSAASPRRSIRATCSSALRRSTVSTKDMLDVRPVDEAVGGHLVERVRLGEVLEHRPVAACR